MLISTPGAAGCTLRDIWDVVKGFPSFLDLLENQDGKLKAAQGTIPKEEVWIPYSLPLLSLQDTSRHKIQLQMGMLLCTLTIFHAIQDSEWNRGKKKIPHQTQTSKSGRSTGSQIPQFFATTWIFPRCKPPEVAEMSCFNNYLNFFFLIAGANRALRGNPEVFLSSREILREKGSAESSSLLL